MGDFRVHINGQEVYTDSDNGRRVEKVHVFTSRGEASASAIDFDQDYINIVFDYRTDSDAELQDAAARDLARDRAESGDEFLHPMGNDTAQRLAEEFNPPAEEEEKSSTKKSSTKKEEVSA